jgi:hypothetical protein
MELIILHCVLIKAYRGFKITYLGVKFQYYVIFNFNNMSRDFLTINCRLRKYYVTEDKERDRLQVKTSKDKTKRFETPSSVETEN